MKSGLKLRIDFGVASISGGFMVGRNIAGLLKDGEELDGEGGENEVGDGLGSSENSAGSRLK